MGILDRLNPMQREAASTIEGPLLILAGAGSGKTRTLTHRIAYMIHEQGVNPWNILAITFTNKAAGEMRERVDDLVGGGAEAVWVMTFHATCVRILRRYIDLLGGYDTNFSIYDTDDQKTVMKAVMKKLNIDPKQYKERTLLSAISHAKDDLISVQEYERSTFGDFTKAVIARAYREYQETLKRSNAVDFDDIICLTVELFQKHPEVLESYQNRFRYIHVDEYQDTNLAQFKLISLLADRYRNLCVVGDDDQSIYKFRGANIRNILDFEQHYPEAKVIKLEQNYRSTQFILDAANAVIHNNYARKDKALWTDRGEGEKIRFMQCDNAYEEAEYIVDDIRSKVRNGGNYNQFAVLYRTNAQARLIEERLVLKGIPYNVVGGTNFYSRAEVKDIIAYLKTVENGQDEVALRRIINVPKRSIGAASIGKIEDYAEIRDYTLFQAMQYASEIPGLGKAAARIEGFVNLIRVLRAGLEDLGVSGTIRKIIDSIDYEEYLQDTYDEDADDRIENVEELYNKAVAYEESAEEPSLHEFLEQVALVSDLDNVDNGDGRVLLMTLHSAKGLEFPNVYLAGMEDGLFPSYMSISSGDQEELEEERRLAYVGITRAMDHLTLTAAKMRMQHGETQFNAVSRFVKEIPTELLDGYLPARKSRDDYDSSERFGGYESSYGRGFGEAPERKAAVAKPRAFGRRGSAPETVKPFIAQGVSALGAAGITKGVAGGGAPDYAVGDRVRHVKFGAGTVTALVSEPRDYKVTVDFDAHGPKVMYASFAKLVKL
jgi:DNA helicase-2/ATP-dependent DNA helicase PcrA